MGLVLLVKRSLVCGGLIWGEGTWVNSFVGFLQFSLAL